MSSPTLGELGSELKRLEALVALAMARAAAAGGAEETVRVVPFSFSTPSPLLLQAILPGHVVDRVSVLITTTFDGAGASLEVGTPGTPGLILGTSDIAPAALGTYANEGLFPFVAADSLQLAIVPGGGATQGAGLVLCKIK